MLIESGAWESTSGATDLEGMDIVNHSDPQLEHREQISAGLPREISPFDESDLIIDGFDENDLETLLGGVEEFSDGDSGLGGLEIGPFDDSDLILEMDVDVGDLAATDNLEIGIIGTFDDENTHPGQPDTFASPSQGDLEPGDVSDATLSDDLGGDDDDAEADIIMGAILMEYLQESESMRGPYGQIPTAEDWFPVSMRWKGDRFRGIYR